MKTKRKVWAVMLVATGIGLSPLLPTQAADDSTAVISFTDRALNPADPDLPLDEPGRVNLPDTNGDAPKQVVVNTTPEKTKKTTTTTHPNLADTDTETTAGRTTLPQTGSMEMSGLTVMSLVLMSLMLVVRVFKQKQEN